MRLNKLRRCGRGAVLSLAFASLVGQAGAANHCKAPEQVAFSCQVGGKVASLCAGGPATAPATLSYRYGRPGKVENEFTARPDNRNRFYATSSPARPGASVNQVWFDRGDTRYVLTECVGGSCSRRGGLAVLRGEKILMNGSCAAAQSDEAAFSREFVQFGSGAADSRSATPLLIIEDADNDIVRIYSQRR